MVVLVLEWRAQLENIKDVQPNSDCNFCIKVKCGSCSEDSDFVWVIPGERNEMPGSRGSANLVMKCKFCRRVGTVDVVEDRPPQALNVGGDWASIVAFECRGVTATEWKPTDDCLFNGSGEESGTEFTDIDLSEEGEWADYDEQGEEAVGISEVEHRFVRA